MSNYKFEVGDKVKIIGNSYMDNAHAAAYSEAGKRLYDGPSAHSDSAYADVYSMSWRHCMSGCAGTIVSKRMVLGKYPVYGVIITASERLNSYYKEIRVGDQRWVEVNEFILEPQ